MFPDRAEAPADSDGRAPAPARGAVLPRRRCSELGVRARAVFHPYSLHVSQHLALPSQHRAAGPPPFRAARAPPVTADTRSRRAQAKCGQGQGADGRVPRLGGTALCAVRTDKASCVRVERALSVEYVCCVSEWPARRV